jgi:hypothetical protein
MRISTLHILATSLLVWPVRVAAQNPSPSSAAQPLNVRAEDDRIIAFLRDHGRRVDGRHAIVWAPRDSTTEAWHAAIVDTLDRGLAELKRLIGAPLAWQRIGDRAVQYMLGPGTFISHGSGKDLVFISVNRALTGRAPWLHEALHELLVPNREPDPAALAEWPLWITEGMPSALATMAATAAGIHEGDIWAVGDRAKIDSVCATRVAANQWKEDLLRVVGGRGRVPALFTTDRSKVAPTFYPCSESMSRFVIETIGVPAAVDLYPSTWDGTWDEKLERAAGMPLAELQARWRVRIGLP